MSLWEYKVITSGKGGFATPALLEKFLNDLGRDEWEIVHFHTPPDNFLAFTGLARRSTQRDWTLEDAAAAAAKAEAEKLRAEFEAKFKAAANTVSAQPEERASSFLEEKVAPDDGFRKPVDTSRDDDPDAEDDEKADEWDKLTAAEEDELPTFFEAIKPHMRRNQRGPGMSVGVDYLAKKWDQSEEDLKGALVECGFVVPNDEDSKAEYVEYDGDLFWLNINRRGELWINTKEKPRPVFRPVKAARIEIEAPAPKEGNAKENGRERGGDNKAESGARTESKQKPEAEDRKAEDSETPAEGAAAEPKVSNGKGSAAPAVPLPEGAALLDKIRPHMRRNRRGPGGSGSTLFLSRALRTNEAELRTAFAGLGLTIPAAPSDKPVYFEIANEVWWLNLDSRGGLWINGREKKEGEALASSAEGTGETPVASTPAESGPAEPASTESTSTETASGESATAESAPADAASVDVPASEISPVPAAVPANDSEAKAETSPETMTPADASSAATAPADATPASSGSGETRPVAAPESGAEAATVAAPVAVDGPLAAARALLKESKPGSVSAKVEHLAGELGKPAEALVATLVDAGLRVPEKPREKPVFVEHAGEVLWLNKTPKGELWLNAKTAKVAEKDVVSEEVEESGEPIEGGEGEGEKKSGRRAPRGRTKKTD